MSSNIHLRESSTDPVPRIKTSPRTASIPVPFAYSPSDDGTDENLLVLLHGLGDTHVPFARLGRQLRLPQTATLALRAPEQIPFLYEQAFQWYPSFDPLGELIDRPNPTPALDLLSKVIDHLTKDCAWPLHRIHLFGFTQGGSVVAEFAIKLWKVQLEKQAKSQPNSGGSEDFKHLGSVVSISGPLLSYPTLSSKCSTPILFFRRSAASQSSSEVTAFKKAFVSLVEVNKSGEDGMPRSKDEWEPIMKFWSEQLGRRQVEGLYEVLSGADNMMITQERL